MAQGDVNFKVSSSYDGKEADKAAQSIGKVDENLKKAGKSADEAAPKLKKYSDELKRTGVAAEELQKITAKGGAGGGGGDGSTGIAGVFSKIGAKVAIAATAILGFRKVVQGISRAPEIQQFTQNVNDAAMALGSLIANSGPIKSGLEKVGGILRGFADSVSPEKLNLGEFVAQIKDSAAAADAAKASYDALIGSLEGTAEAINKNKGGTLEEQAARLEAGANKLMSGGDVGFDIPASEEDMAAKGNEIGSLLSREAEIVNEIRREREHLNEKLTFKPSALAVGMSAMGVDFRMNAEERMHQTQAALAQSIFDARTGGMSSELQDVRKKLTDARRFVDPSIVDENTGRAFAIASQSRHADAMLKASSLATPMREQARALRIQAGNAVREANPEQYRMISGVEYQAQVAPFTSAQNTANTLRGQQAGAATNAGLYYASREAAAAAEELKKIAPALHALLQSIKNSTR